MSINSNDYIKELISLYHDHDDGRSQYTCSVVVVSMKADHAPLMCAGLCNELEDEPFFYF